MSSKEPCLCSNQSTRTLEMETLEPANRDVVCGQTYEFSDTNGLFGKLLGAKSRWVRIARKQKPVDGNCTQPRTCKNVQPVTQEAERLARSIPRYFLRLQEQSFDSGPLPSRPVSLSLLFFRPIFRRRRSREAFVVVVVRIK